MKFASFCRVAAIVAAVLPVGSAFAQQVSGPVGGTAKAVPLPTKPAVLVAISRMMRVVGENGATPQAPNGKSGDQWNADMKLVAQFAEKSPNVTIAINPRFASISGKGDAFFLAYYLAGATRYDLQNPMRAKDLYADQAAAVRAELLAYKYMKSRGAKGTRPLLDDLQAKNASGTLEKYVAQVAKTDAKSAPPKR